MAPELSVVVVAGPLRERAAPCLASLAAQGLGERLEVLLVDLGPEGGRARAVPEASAPVVAFLEEHTRVLFFRIYGPLRASEGRWGLGRRAFYVGATPLIPLYSLLLALHRYRARRPERESSSSETRPLSTPSSSARRGGRRSGSCSAWETRRPASPPTSCRSPARRREALPRSPSPLPGSKH